MLKFMSENFKNIVEYYGGHNSDEGVKKLILDLYHQARNTVQPNRWLLDLEHKLVQTDWITLLQQYILHQSQQMELHFVIMVLLDVACLNPLTHGEHHHGLRLEYNL